MAELHGKFLVQRFLGAALEILFAGLIAVFYTELMDTGRGYQPNPIFWKTFIMTHLTFLLVIPLFSNGRTIGMLLTNLTVTSNNGKKPNFAQILARAFLGFGPVIVSNGLWYFISIFISLTDEKGRGWSELVSYTTIKQKNPH
ncbi:RDD family protein [Halobacillus litoralis]|uniref:RDD family protein n=1 Tax=Halobacillus litoralis TaxID=45668 RepID=UPI002491D1A5|nr:RDD family protein [Halobacillus litoralis]